MKTCALIPTYNNATTLGDIIDRTLATGYPLVVVNDGSSDDTAEVLQRYAGNPQVDIVSYVRNRGKGYALCRGFERVKSLGYDYAVTLDADGQHKPEEISLLEQAAVDTAKGVLVVGCRNLRADGMPGKNTFANRFSNFWFRLQTGCALADTQSGYRLYDLRHLPSFRFLTRRYECELELLVFSAWRGVRIIPVAVQVYYPPKEERVSHFRPFADFARITLLNTCLTLVTPFAMIIQIFKQTS